jgi:hypothetical protein
MSTSKILEFATNEKIHTWAASLPLDERDTILTNALNIGRLAIKCSIDINSEEFAMMRDTVGTVIKDSLDNTRLLGSVDSLVTEIRNIGFGSSGSSKKGKSNELLILKKMMSIPNWTFTRISQEEMSCDLRAIRDNQRVMIELKEYTTNVPTKEINKFYRDIEAHTPDAALFLSNSGITGQSNDYEVVSRFIGGKKIPILFVANCHATTWVVAFLLLESIMANYSTMDVDYDEVNEIINDVSIRLIGSTEKLKIIDEEISRVRLEYSENRKKINELLDTTYKSILSLECMMKNELLLITDTFSEITASKKAHFSGNDLMLQTKDDFTKWLAAKGTNKQREYTYLWNAIKHYNKTTKCNSKIIVAFNEAEKSIMLIHEQMRIVIAKTSEKPQSVQLTYSVLPWDGMDMAFSYEVTNVSGYVYFNLSKIKNEIGEQKLADRLALMMNRHNKELE